MENKRCEKCGYLVTNHKAGAMECPSISVELHPEKGWSERFDEKFSNIYAGSVRFVAHGIDEEDDYLLCTNEEIKAFIYQVVKDTENRIRKEYEKKIDDLPQYIDSDNKDLQKRTGHKCNVMIWRGDIINEGIK